MYRYSIVHFQNAILLAKRLLFLTFFCSAAPDFELIFSWFRFRPFVMAWIRPREIYRDSIGAAIVADGTIDAVALDFDLAGVFSATTSIFLAFDRVLFAIGLASVVSDVRGLFGISKRIVCCNLGLAAAGLVKATCFILFPSDRALFAIESFGFGFVSLLFAISINASFTAFA